MKKGSPMQDDDLRALRRGLTGLTRAAPVGRVQAISGNLVSISGLSGDVRVGDFVSIGDRLAEVCAIDQSAVHVVPEGGCEGMGIQAPVVVTGPPMLTPSNSWLGRVIDPLGRPLDGRPLGRGGAEIPVHAPPPPATQRRGFGARFETSLSVFNTFLPIVRGQRVGLFAGSGVGKSTLMGALAGFIPADVTVVALIGERGREVGDFIHRVLGPEAMKSTVVIAATSDQSAMMRRMAAYSAMSVAEYFRDQGAQVVYFADSVTRLAEAHREVALSLGEAASMNGFPPSTSQAITRLAERAGPGAGESGDITAIFSVLVAGSDMEGPVADILRGVLDGHVVLDREIAERGRYPAIDVLRSVSRSLPHAATDEENKVLAIGRRMLGAYEQSKLMIQAGLYEAGTDPETDAAIKAYPHIDAFLTGDQDVSVEESFSRLMRCFQKR